MVEEAEVAAVDERVAFLEGRSLEHTHMLNGIREAIINLELRMDRRFELVEHRLTALDLKLDQATATLNHKLDQRFGWLVGIQVTTLLAIVAAMAAIVGR